MVPISICISGTDVYVVGTEVVSPLTSVIKLWKNGVVTTITNGINRAEASSVFVSGTDVYISGGEQIGPNFVNRVWKNGIATSLTNGNFNASGNAIFVK
jgi:3-keto-L-gulonate-6-phosphate decarboxylase